MTEIKLNVAGVGNDGGMLVRLDDVKSIFQSQSERIAELEEETKHLKQVIYNTAKSSFEAGACCPYVAFHEHAILFAKKITKEQGE